MITVYLIIAVVIAVFDSINLNQVRLSRVLGAFLWPIALPVLVWIMIVK